jgi:hypothetical protein
LAYGAKTLSTNALEAHHCMPFGRVGDLLGAEVKTMAKVVQMLQIEIMSSTMHIKQAVLLVGDRQ